MEEGNQAATREPLPRELSGRRDGQIMPLVEELERLRVELAAAKARLAATTAEIPRLKSLIESTNGAIAKGKEEERRKQAALDALQRRLAGRGQDDELSRVLSEVAAARGAKDALERRALVRRQAARALRLAERALAAETHALAWSATAAAETLQLSGAARDEAALHHDVVALPARRHEELRRAVEAEERHAEARVEEAEAARRAARARRAAAVARLDAARARRREAGAGQGRQGRDADDRRRRGKMEARTGQPRSRFSSRARLVVKKLGGFLCSKVSKA